MNKGSALRPALTAVIYCLMAALVTIVFLAQPGINRNVNAGFGDQVRGTVPRPFCYRALAPVVIRTATSLVPRRWAPDTEFFRKKPELKAAAINDDDLRFLPAATLLWFLCFVGILYSLRSLTGAFYRLPDFARDMAPVFGLLLVPLLFRYQNFIYDPITLALFCAGLVMIVRGDNWWYYPLLVLASVNKETAILLPAVYWFWNRTRLAPTKLAVQIAVQALLVLGVKSWLMVHFTNQPGTALEFHLLDHNLILYRWPVMAGYFAVAVAVLGFLVCHQWRSKDRFLRGGLLLTLLPLVAACLFFGQIDELRDYYEAFPFIYLLAVHSLWAVWNPGNAAITLSPNSGKAGHTST